MNHLDSVENLFEDGLKRFRRQRTIRRQPRRKSIRNIIFLRQRIRSFHSIVEKIFVFADVINLKESGSLLCNRAVVDDALQLASPEFAEPTFRNDFHGKFFSGNIAAKPHFTKCSAPAELKQRQIMINRTGGKTHTKSFLLQ